MYVKDIVINIKLDHGDMEISAPAFLTETSSPDKLKLMTELCRKSDKDYGTTAVDDFRRVCQLLLNGQIGLYRITNKLRQRLDKFIMDLGTPLAEKPKGNKRLF